MTSEQQRLDPSDDPRARIRAHAAMTAVYYQMQNLLARYYDENGRYIEPSGIGDGGDNTGMMYAANNDVLRKLDEEVKRARETMLAVFAEIDAYKSERFGPGYKPLPRKL